MIDIFYPASSLTTYLSGVVNRTVLLFLLLVSLQRVALSIVLRGTRSAYAAPFCTNSFRYDQRPWLRFTWLTAITRPATEHFLFLCYNVQVESCTCISQSPDTPRGGCKMCPYFRFRNKEVNPNRGYILTRRSVARHLSLWPSALR